MKNWKERLKEAHENRRHIDGAKRNNKEYTQNSIRDWISNQLWPTFEKLKIELEKLNNVEGVSLNNDDVKKASLNFKYGENSLTYSICFEVSSKGVVGQTVFKFKNQKIYTNPNITEILNWKEKEITNDFVKAYEHWIV